MPVPLPSQYRITTNSSLAEETGVAVDRTDDGDSATRDLYARSYFAIDAEFGPLLPVDNAALMEFLRANRSEEIDLSIDGITYRCRIVKPPSVKFVGGMLRQVSAGLRGYAL